MINMTVGPVMSHERILNIAGLQTPYFRTSEFSEIMLDSEKRLLKMLDAPDGSKCAFLTTSGTGGMEACVIGTLAPNDKVAVINGGTFGQRFVDLCKMHDISVVEVQCKFGEQITKKSIEDLKEYGITALLVNMDETSSGLLYDMKIISDFCKQNGIFLVVDAISSFLADYISMSDIGANVIIIASQKALALQPGMSFVVLDPTAIERVYQTDNHNMYLSIKAALENMRRGQTPYTPAVSIVYQLNERLKMIEECGGVAYEIDNVKKLATFFRNKIATCYFELLITNPRDMSNAVTAIRVKNNNAAFICEELKNKFDIWVCPNGGIYKDSVFRVGHIGALSIDDYHILGNALAQMESDGLL